MQQIVRLINPIQSYAWGSRTALAELLGQPSPSAAPQAELWLGAHPSAPSQVELPDGRKLALGDLIAAAPRAILGDRVALRFGNRLPLLFKVLAAGAPLSIQAHPNLHQAREGFARENEAGIPLSAPHRNYRDDNHKPEIICAATPFWALNGFRPLAQLQHLLADAAAPALAPFLARLQRQPGSEGLKHAFAELMNSPADVRAAIVAQVTAQAQVRAPQPGPDAAIWQWVLRLEATYPGDLGIITPLLLNLVHLDPGEAMYLPAGELHAYLDGTGIELMANSDNVLRGGLTPKHVDVPELLRVLTFRLQAPEILRPHADAPGISHYVTGAAEFRLSVLHIAPGQAYQAPLERGVEILLVWQGTAVIAPLGPDGGSLTLTRGQSVLVPAAATGYTLSGHATLYRASVP